MWYVFPNDETGSWDIRDEHDTWIATCESESMAKLIVDAVYFYEAYKAS